MMMGGELMPYWWELQMAGLALDVAWYCLLPMLIPILVYTGACYGIGWLYQMIRNRSEKG
ncbi:MAG: hypothetical protein AAF702_11845 [Chloroflexota bacterium]